MSMRVSKGFFKAVEKGWTKEFNKYKRKLNKAQLKKLDKYLDKQVKSMNDMVDKFGPMIQHAQGVKLKHKKKNDPFIKHISVGYIMYTLLKMKKPNIPVYRGSVGDPYTCGPEYFRPACCNPGVNYENF